MKFDREIEAPQMSFREAKRTTPDRAGNILIWLVFSAGCIVLYIILAAMVVSKHLYMNIAGWMGFLTIVAVILLVVVDKDAIRTVEQIWGHDLDGDGYVGQPPVNEFNYRISERSMQRAKLPGPEPVIREWIGVALNGGSMAYATWEKRFAYRTDGKDGAERYRAFREALCSAGWAIEQGTHSIALTQNGEMALEDWLMQHPNPIPLLDA